MNWVEAAASHPILAIAWLLALVVVVAMTMRSRYRIRVRRKDFEILVEPHDQKRAGGASRGPPRVRPRS